MHMFSPYAAAGCGIQQAQLRQVAIDKRHPLLRVLGIAPFRFLKGLVNHLCRRLRERGPHALGFGARAGRSDRMRRLQLAHDVCGGTDPWPDGIDGRHRRHPFAVRALTWLPPMAAGGGMRSGGLARSCSQARCSASARPCHPR